MCVCIVHICCIFHYLSQLFKELKAISSSVGNKECLSNWKISLPLLVFIRVQNADELPKPNFKRYEGEKEKRGNFSVHDDVRV